MLSFSKKIQQTLLTKIKRNAKIKKSLSDKNIKSFSKKNLTKKKINDKILKCQIDINKFFNKCGCSLVVKPQSSKLML